MASIPDCPTVRFAPGFRGLSLRNSPTHLVSDLEGTWLPSPAGEVHLRRLEAFLEGCPEVVLTLATGRDLDSALALLKEHDARMPDHLVTDAGTALYHAGPGGAWTEDGGYAAWVASRWDTSTKAKLLNEGLPRGVHIQPGLDPLRHLALEVSEPRDLPRATAELQVVLDILNIPAEVLVFGERWIDVLPGGVDKGTAVEFLEHRLGCPRPLIACGDSENDLDLFYIADVAVVMVDTPPDLDRSLLPRARMVRAPKPGPEGILELLLAWDTGLREGA